MKIEMGPILGFQGNSGGMWKVCALFVSSQGVPTINCKRNGKALKISKVVLKEYEGLVVSLHAWEIPQEDIDQKITYSLGNESWKFFVPAKEVIGKSPRLRLAYASCNGFSSPAEMKKVADKNERWKNLLAKHSEQPFHLLLMGGDQVYADPLWEVAPLIKEWVNKLKRFRLKSEFTPEMRKETEHFYFHLYCERWKQEDMRTALATIPTLMMWDDHDIFDGWGSYDKDMQGCKVYQGIFKQAQEHFRIFQLKSADAPAGSLKTPGFSYAFKIGKIAIVIPDLRSERSMEQVMSEESWSQIYNWINTNAPDCSHLLFLASIPVVYPSFNLLEAILGVIPGRQEIEDDLRDHWTSNSHKAERIRLIHRLLSISSKHKCRITILSGDVHVGAVAQITSNLYSGATTLDTVHQFISSGIVHPCPPALALYFLKSLGDNAEKVDDGITACMGEFPSTRTPFISARNWLSLTVDPEQGRLWGEWFAEGEAAPFTKVVHPHLKVGGGASNPSSLPLPKEGD